VPGACPQCGGWQFTVNRCAHCRLDDLDYARTHSNAGRLFDAHSDDADQSFRSDADQSGAKRRRAFSV